MNTDIAPLQSYLTDTIRQFRALKKQAEKALAQTNTDQFFVTIDQESNSLAIIMKHIAGNLRSRWTDFFTSDGEKPDRHRDSEFVIEDGETREIVLKKWDDSWNVLFAVLDNLTISDLNRTVLIRNEPHLVIEALNRQLTHYAAHVGQIVFLARHLASDHWQSLSIPRGQSAQFNASAHSKRGDIWQSVSHTIPADNVKS